MHGNLNFKREPKQFGAGWW